VRGLVETVRVKVNLTYSNSLISIPLEFKFVTKISTCLKKERKKKKMRSITRWDEELLFSKYLFENF